MTQTTPGQRFQEALRKEYADGWRDVYNDETRKKFGDDNFRLNIGPILRALLAANVHIADGVPNEE